MSVDRPPRELHQGDLLETTRKQVQIMFLRLPKEESRSASGNNGANLFAAVTSRSLDTEGRGVRRSCPPRRSSIRTGVRLIVHPSLARLADPTLMADGPTRNDSVEYQHGQHFLRLGLAHTTAESLDH